MTAGKRHERRQKAPREGTMTHKGWHRFVNNLGVQIDVKKLSEELGTKDIHSKIEVVSNNYSLDIRRVGPSLYVLDELYE